MHSPGTTLRASSPAPARASDRAGRPRVAFGPEMPGFGSWEWIGAELARTVPGEFQTSVFRDSIPECDAVVFVKQRPDARTIRRVARSSAVIFCPVDLYGSPADIDADAEVLLSCDRVLVHCERLRKYFASYARVEYVDHHVRFAAPLRKEFTAEGPILWVGVRSNLRPLVDWTARHRLPGELWVLTNPEDPQRPLDPVEFGFRSGAVARMEAWTPERHIEWLSVARAALDVKGDDFRARHKPPVKALDFIASGVPLAMNADSSSVEHLARMGFDVASPEEPDRWLSQPYWQETVRFGGAVRELLSRERVSRRFRRILHDVLAERGRTRMPGNDRTPVPGSELEIGPSRKTHANPQREQGSSWSSPLLAHASSAPFLAHASG